MRSIGVKLTAETASYTQSLKRAEKATGDLAHQIGQARGESVSAKVATERLGKAIGDTGRETARFGVSTTVAARHVDQLGDEIRNVERELVVMAAAFATAGSQADRLDISKAIRRTEADLRRLNKNKGLLSAILPSPGEVDTAGAKVGSGLMTSIGSAVSSASPAALAAGALGAAFAPTIGAAAAGAVVGGAGLGGVIGGLVLVGKDPRIQGEAKAIGSSFAASVNESAKDAFLVPAERALGQIADLAARSAPKIGKAFAATAPSVDGLTRSLVGAGDALLDSFVHAAQKSGPVLDALGRIVQGTGHSIGAFIDMAADHAAEGASALDDLNTALQNTIKLGTTIGGALGSVKGGLDSFDDGIDKARYATEDFFTKLAGGRTVFDITADGYTKGSEAAELYRRGVIGASGSLNDYQHYLEGAKGGTKALGGTMDEAATATGLYRKELGRLNTVLRAETDPLFAFVTAQDKVADAQGRLNAAIRKYGPNSRQAADATRELAGAAVDLQGKASAVGVTADGKLTPALRRALEAANLTKGQIRGVEGQLKTARAALDKYDGNYAARVTAPGAKAVERQLSRLLAYQQALKRGMRVGFQGPVKGDDGNYYASGGPVRGPGTGTSDSIAARLSHGEHVWTAREVSAAGGHGAVMQMRSAVLSAPAQRFADGGPAARQGTRVMPAMASSVTTVVYEHRVTFADTQNEIGQLLVKAIRTSPGVRAEMAQRLGVRKAG